MRSAGTLVRCDEPMKRIAYFDCTSGISGDMTLGALVDAGVPLEAIQDAIGSMGLGEVQVTASVVKKHGFRATWIQIVHPPEHKHRHLHHIEAMIDRGALREGARVRAKAIFHRLAVAEAKVHGSTIEKVHFHEVGAIDSIADIVGSAVALDWLGIDSIVASPVPTGHGTITIAHGVVGIPAPATAELLRGVPIAAADVSFELTTPTGAAILAACCSSFGPMPAMAIDSIGYGAGTRDLSDRPNTLRVLIGNVVEKIMPYPHESDRVWVLETDIDDATGQQLAHCTQRLWSEGALDVVQFAIQMKKGRLGTRIQVLASESRIAAIESTLLTHTTTIGVRRHLAERTKLIRRPLTVETPFGPLVGKACWLPTGRWRFQVECDQAAQVASDRGCSLAEVQRAAEAAFDPNALPAPTLQ
jgi:pyridinium-3,5-bisthiocarboxylic acid mononucleotide nickel chelatase